MLLYMFFIQYFTLQWRKNLIMSSILKYIMRKYIFILIILTLLFSSFQDISSKQLIAIPSCDKGPSFTNVIPIKKVTFVNMDEEGLLDDYTYLAAIPTSVFYNQTDNNLKRLFSHPLLFYQDEYDYDEDIERTLNPRQGLNYFMEDWLGFSNDNLDQIILLNVPKGKAMQWAAKDYVTINENNPFAMANAIALQDWSFSNKAVIAVIEEDYKEPDNITTGTITGTLNKASVEENTYQIEPPTVGIGSTYKTFEVNDETYKYIAAKLRWTGDIYYDIQLIDEQLGMVAVAMGSRVGVGPVKEEYIGGTSYIHNYGTWRTDITAVPMKATLDNFNLDSSNEPIRTNGILSRLKQNQMNIDITLYPGVDLILEDQPPFACRDVEFTLTWNNPNQHLGFTILDPVGNEIASSLSSDELFTGEQQNNNAEASITINRLGECKEDTHYSICVFSLNPVNEPIDFAIDYKWRQNYSKAYGNGIASATNGAILASMLNAPLIYTSSNIILKETKNVLTKLGVKDVYVANLGDQLSPQVVNELKGITNIQNNFVDAKEIYDEIRKISGQNDVIFSTIEPWHYWLAVDTWNGNSIIRKPAGVKSGSFHFAPAAYLAAHQGSPLLLVDYHPKLSQAATWSTDWWIKNAINRIQSPPAANMVITAHRTYEFLEENDFGFIETGDSSIQDQEIIITVADQYQIGIPWDRSFLGAALPGRFWGSPVDTAYAISRSIFYPSLVFENPAMEKVTLTQASSSSTSQPLIGRLKKPVGVNLVITEEMKEEQFTYPILHMYNTYLYRFNELASNHWDFMYTRADGITPYITPSPDDIDEGAAITKSGKYYPDISESEVIPFYAEKAGYDNVFATNFDYVTKNLNGGVLIWVVNAHGWHRNGGMLSYWNPDSPYIFEENPWRAYEPVALKPGNLGKYLRSYLLNIYELQFASGDTAYQYESLVHTIEKINNFITFSFPLQLFPEVASTEHPDASAINYQLERWVGLTQSIRSLLFAPDAWNARGIIIYRNIFERLQKNLPLINWYQGDGKVTSHYATGHFPAMQWEDGITLDDKLENIHCVGINAISCMPTNTYMHLTWMRHGSIYQIMDPWTTTDWSGVWQQIVMKRFALGDTVGEAYERGIQAAGPLYSIGQWWWDAHENICLFGHPNQRVFVPENDYSNANYWTITDVRPIQWDGKTDLFVDGHALFGADEYPHQHNPTVFFDNYMIIIAIISIILLVGIAIILNKKRNKKSHIK